MPDLVLEGLVLVLVLYFVSLIQLLLKLLVNRVLCVVRSAGLVRAEETNVPGVKLLISSVLTFDHDVILT